jgi:hypothetical protein
MALDTKNRPGSQYDDDWRDKHQSTPSAEELQDQFDAPSATDADLPENHPDRNNSLSPAALQSAEKAPGSPSTGAADKKEASLGASDGSNSWDTNVKPKSGKGSTKKRGLLLRPRHALAAGAATLVIGGGFGLFSTLHGPLQFLNLESALGKHSRISSIAADARLFGFTRAARAYKTGNIGETRVGYLGSRSFNALLDRLESRHGIITSERMATGRPHNVRINPKEGSPLRGATLAETEANIRKFLSIPDDTTIYRVGQAGDGSPIFRLFTRDTNAKNINSMVKSMVSLDNQSANKTKGSTHLAMRKRFLKNVWSVPALFSPMERAAYKADQKIRTTLEKRQAERDRKNRTGKRAQLRAKYRNAISQARNRIGTRNLTSAGVALTFTGGLCVLKEMSGLLPALNYAAINTPAMEEAIDKQAVPSQMKSGQNFVTGQLGDVAETFVDHNGRTIWSSKPLGGGAEADPGLKQAFEMRGSNIDSLVDLLVADSGDNTLIEAAAAGGDAFANIACSPGGYAVQIVAGGAMTLLAPGGAILKTAQFAQSAAVVAVITHLFADLVEGEVESAARGLCGQDEEGRTVDAAAFGSCMAYGARAAHNMNAASMGGIELSSSEEIDMVMELEELERAEFSNKSLASRLFNLGEPRSLAATILKRGSPSLSHNLSNIASSILSAPMTFTGNLASSLTKRVHAESDSYDWGFPLVSVPLSIIEDPKYEDPFENAQKFVDIYNHGDADIERARACWGVDIKRVNGRLAAVVEEEVVPIENEYVKANCNDLSKDDWVRTMLFVFDDALVTSMDCYEGGEQSCGEIGFGSTTATAPVNQGQIVGDPYTDGVDVPCAEGTNNRGTTTGYINGRSFNIRLCSLPNLPSSGQSDNPGGQFSTPGANGYAIVNSRVSGAWFNLVNDAKAAGINLQATSTFRSMNHQSSLCNNNSRCRNGNYSLVARPGYSSHQAGVAIDFANGMGGITGGKTCSSRARAPGSEAWMWLANNAEDYGFKQYAYEAWHWDALNSSNRCGSI